MRVLLKISGESLGSDKNFCDSDHLLPYLKLIEQGMQDGIQIGIVTGGGNILRGKEHADLCSRQCGDKIGILSTMINSLIIADRLTVPSVVYSAIGMSSVAYPFELEKVLRDFENKVPVFAAGIGQPYFSTDTAAALRAIQTHCDYVIKLTEVGGVYTQDPKIYPQADFLKELSFQDVMDKQYKVMDIAAFDLCQQHNIPIIVTSIQAVTSLKDLIQGLNKATFIRPQKSQISSVVS